MAPRYTVSGDSIADLRKALEELVDGASTDSTGAVEDKKPRSGGRRGVAKAPDPAPIPQAPDPFAQSATSESPGAGGDPFAPSAAQATTSANDPFSTAAQPSPGADPFGAPQTAPTTADPFNPNAAPASADNPFAQQPALSLVETLLARFKERVDAGSDQEMVRKFIVQQLGLSPSVSLADAVAALRKAPDDTVAKMLHLTSGGKA